MSQTKMFVSSRELLLPDFLKLIRKTFPKGTIFGTPSGDLYKVCTRAVINEKEQRICVVLNPVGKTLEKKKALYSQLGMKSKDYSSMVDRSWLWGKI